MFSCFVFQVFLILRLEMSYNSVQKAFCVLEYAKTQSFKAVQRAFAQRFEKTRSEQVPDKNHIWIWHKKFKEGCLCTVKGSGRTPISERNVEQIRIKLVNNPRKSIRRTNFETQIPKSTVWRIVIKRLQMRPYKLRFVQVLKGDDK